MTWLAWYVDRWPHDGSTGVWYTPRDPMTPADAWHEEFDIERTNLGATPFRWFWDGSNWQFDARPRSALLSTRTWG